MVTACSGNDTPGQETDETERYVADFTVPPDCGLNHAKTQHDSLYVINSEEEWANIFTCGSSPEIDFSTKTLLVASGWAASGIASISKELVFENDVLYLKVDIELDITAVAQTWRMGLITDKLHPGSSIELKISTDNGEEFVNPYRETVIGKWKLQNVTYAYDNEEKKSVEFKDIPVLYEFKDSNKLTVTGDESILPDDILIPEGEHSYEYTKLNVGILALPAPNLRIDQREPLYCFALANDNIMTLGGEMFDQQSGKTVKWNKTFIEQNY
jgi:hypothetical protein